MRIRSSSVVSRLSDFTHHWLGRNLGAIVALTLLASGGRAAEPPAVEFRRDVLPILSDHCFQCHGPDARARKADLRLDQKASALRTQEPVIVPGHSSESEIVARLVSTDPDEVMPPASLKKPLSASQIATIRRWIDSGASWQEHWAFEPIRPLDPPTSPWPASVRNPIDRFVHQGLKKDGLQPAPEADATTLIRRLSLDLTGLPPTLEEVDAYLADTSPSAYDRLVSRLLASPAYGERMASDWLDQARYADTNGYQNDFARTMWPWRDWVIRSFNRNQPLDHFILEQIAGDLLPHATRDQRVATGFNRNNRTVTEAGSIEEEWRIENAVDRVETTATVFLGLTMGCVRCHDHKYDPIPQPEFYRFLAFFNSVNEKGVYTETRGNVPPLVKVPSPREEQAIAALTAAIALGEHKLSESRARLAERQEIWEAQLVSRTSQEDEPRDWLLRLALTGSLTLESTRQPAATARYVAGDKPTWIEGPGGQALRLDGTDRSYVETAMPIDLEGASAFSYGAWVRPTGSGTILSRMDDANAFRGFDLLVQDQLRVEVHLVHTWPTDALKVITRTPLSKSSWSHVFVTYDGSKKADGVKLYINGEVQPVDVEVDHLQGTIRTDQALRIGRRSTAFPFHGDLADVRIYARTLPVAEVQKVLASPILAIARIPRAKRTTEQIERIARYYREAVDEDDRATSASLAALRKQKDDAEKTIPTVMVMEDTAKPRETFVLKRGRYDMPDPSSKVEPGVPSCLPPLPSDAPRSRLGLARWLVSPENPLTARVMVNRIWEHHFGVGLVKTSENFGMQSEPPSHPELLNWLAGELIRSGWDLKALHRLIVSSAAYRQVSRASAESIARDPENRRLARGPRFRLPAETVRDNALAISGLLVTRLGGPSIKPYQPAGLWDELAGGAGEGPYVQDQGPNLYRRSLYVYRKRTVPHPAMANFDAPSREFCQVKRPRTNTPLQALELLNDVTYVEAARGLAELMITRGGASPSERIAWGFRRATARRPSDREAQVLLSGLERYRELYRQSPPTARELTRIGASEPPRGIDETELAAYTATASVILNLDETITRE
ncbi:MAG: DUF1553 domain-containing protein [Isosphaeraceae bacterium]